MCVHTLVIETAQTETTTMATRSNTKNRQAFLNGVWLGMSVDHAIAEAQRLMMANANTGDGPAIQQAYDRAARRMAALTAAYPDRGALS